MSEFKSQMSCHFGSPNYTWNSPYVHNGLFPFFFFAIMNQVAWPNSHFTRIKMSLENMQYEQERVCFYLVFPPLSFYTYLFPQHLSLWMKRDWINFFFRVKRLTSLRILMLALPPYKWKSFCKENRSKGIGAGPLQKSLVWLFVIS